MRNYPWPGNVRQLRNVMESAVVLAEGQEIRPEDLALHEFRWHGSDSDASSEGTNGSHNPCRTSTPNSKGSTPEELLERFDTLNVEVWEQRLIQAALKKTQGNIPFAAEMIGMARATLYRKIERIPNSNLINPTKAHLITR